MATPTYKTTNIADDVQAFLKTGSDGTRAWGGGTLTKTGDKATYDYTDRDGQAGSLTFGPNQSNQTLYNFAMQNSNLYDQWSSQYGQEGINKLLLGGNEQNTTTPNTTTPSTTPSTTTNTTIPTLDDVEPIPESNSTPTASYAAPAEYTIDPTKLPSGQLNTLLEENNPLMQRAARAGERTAQSRGLLNSSMAIGAAQGAVMDQAMPLAQANADVYTEAGLAAYQGNVDASLLNLQAKISSDLAYQDMIQSDYLNQRNLTLQGMISSGLSEQEAAQSLRQIEYQGLINAGLSNQQALDKLDQIELTNQGSLALANQQQSGDLTTLNQQHINDLALDTQQQGGANYRADIENSINTAKIAAADREIFNNSMSNYGLQFQQDISNIQLNKELSTEEKTKNIVIAQTIYETNMNNLAANYEVGMTWSTPYNPDGTLRATDNADNTTQGSYSGLANPTNIDTTADVLPTAENRFVTNADGTTTEYMGENWITGEPVYKTSDPINLNMLQGGN